jgi:hypothetical protein
VFPEALVIHAFKTAQQTFVTLRSTYAAITVLVECNRLASATPAKGIEEKMHDFGMKYKKSDKN